MHWNNVLFWNFNYLIHPMFSMFWVYSIEQIVFEWSLFFSDTLYIRTGGDEICSDSLYLGHRHFENYYLLSLEHFYFEKLPFRINIHLDAHTYISDTNNPDTTYITDINLWTYFSNSHLEVFLCDVNSSFSEGVHTSFCANALYDTNKFNEINLKGLI